MILCVSFAQELVVLLWISCSYLLLKFGAQNIVRNTFLDFHIFNYAKLSSSVFEFNTVKSTFCFP